MFFNLKKKKAIQIELKRPMKMCKLLSKILSHIFVSTMRGLE